ncbi:hypothetical protein FRX31_028832 [Thalictrum thalictroides]|uniref:Uncharacterized protein n=1 Tax=Thalictrum thalictroides TaxID=46969 RepID=A0A7J6VB39_THATH|nr:hypothetical protein FRX31_028832 [Thalictrum thalictroides]
MNVCFFPLSTFSPSKENQEEDDTKKRITAANVAARVGVAVIGVDTVSKWQLMDEPARQKHEGVDSYVGQIGRDIIRKPFGCQNPCWSTAFWIKYVLMLQKHNDAIVQ